MKRACLILISLLALPRPASGQVIQEFALPGAGFGESLVSGTDGALWFVDPFVSDWYVGVRRFALDGHSDFYSHPSLGCDIPDHVPGCYVSGIASSASGGVWVSGFNGVSLYRVSTAGEFALVTYSPWLTTIVEGGDGNVWGPTWWGIARVTPAGDMTTFRLSSYSLHARRIAVGPDGNLWFTCESSGEPAVSRIGRITLQGAITEFDLPSRSRPNGIVAGPDGNLWFTAYGRIGRMTPAGHLTLFAAPSSGNAEITAGADGNLWFTDRDYARLGRITPSGIVTTWPIPSRGLPQGITAGADGAIWFTEYGRFQIGRVDLSAAPVDANVPTLPAGALAGLAALLAATGLVLLRLRG